VLGKQCLVAFVIILPFDCKIDLGSDIKLTHRLEQGRLVHGDVRLDVVAVLGLDERELAEATVHCAPAVAVLIHILTDVTTIILSGKRVCVTPFRIIFNPISYRLGF